MGAWLALKFAVANPQMVDKLALLCPAGIGAQKTSFAFVALFHALLGEKGIERLYRKVNGGKTIPQVMMDYQIQTGAHSALFGYRTDAIDYAVHFICRTKRCNVSLAENSTRYRNLVPNAKVIVLQEAGHTLIV